MRVYSRNSGLHLKIYSFELCCNKIIINKKYVYKKIEFQTASFLFKEKLFILNFYSNITRPHLYEYLRTKIKYYDYFFIKENKNENNI